MTASKVALSIVRSDSSGGPSERVIVALVAAVQFINIVDFMMIAPLGPDLTRALGITSDHLALITGAYTASAALTAMIAAGHLDRFDRRTALVVFLCGLGCSTALAAAANNLWSLLAARALAGCFGGPATSVAMAILVDNVPESRRGRAIGWVMGSFSLSAIAGVPVGLNLALWHGWPTPFLTIGATGVATAALAWRILATMAPVERAERRMRLAPLLARTEVRYAYAATACAFIGAFLLIPNYSAWFQFNLGFPRAALDTLYLYGGVTALVCQQAAGRVIDRLGPPPVAWTAMAATVAMITAAFIFAIHLPAAAIFVVLMGANATRNVALQTVSTRVPRANERAGFMAVQAAVRHASTTVAAVLAALILASGSGQQLLHTDRLGAVAALFAALVPVWIHLLHRRLASAVAA